jgi:UDP-glucose 4-epimerase
MISRPIFVAGGAGFIGSSLVSRLLAEGDRVVIYDNFSSGQMWHLGSWQEDKALTIVRGDIKEFDLLRKAIEESAPETVYHFASNPDIARAMLDPLIDFWQGTFLTQNVVEAARQAGTVKRVMYASGSGVYGDAGKTPVHEAMSPMWPSSTYGASKLAGEALFSAYCHMYDLQALCFRFANVVGPSQTHGVSYDFIKKLSRDSTRLEILCDGRQSKSYIHVDDVITAMRMLDRSNKRRFDCFNVATEDYMTVNEIADLAVEEMGLKNVVYQHAGGERGWKGDIPIVRFNTEKIRALGWKNRYTTKEATKFPSGARVSRSYLAGYRCDSCLP